MGSAARSRLRAGLEHRFRRCRVWGKLHGWPTGLPVQRTAVSGNLLVSSRCPRPESIAGNSPGGGGTGGAAGFGGGGDLSGERPEGPAQERSLFSGDIGGMLGPGGFSGCRTRGGRYLPFRGAPDIRRRQAASRNRPTMDGPPCRRSASGVHLSGPDRLLCFGGDKWPGRPSRIGCPAPAAAAL